MQIPEYEAYGLLREGGRSPKVVGVCDWADRGRGKGSVQVRIYRHSWMTGRRAMLISDYRYPHIATEVLCSEIWSIVETCINEQKQLLVPCWEIVLDRSPDDMKTQMTMASHFAKINSVFMTKKPAEVCAILFCGFVSSAFARCSPSFNHNPTSSNDFSDISKHPHLWTFSPELYNWMRLSQIAMC